MFSSPNAVRYVPAGKSKADAEIALIRTILGLGPLHDVVEAVRILHSEGRESLERALAKANGDSNDREQG